VNRVHHFYCSREGWKRHVREDLVPAALEEVDLGDEVLEVGPGFGPATDALVGRVESLTALEIDPALAAGLRARFGSQVRVCEGDGTNLPFPDGSFSGAACFTMLHHVPTRALQDRLFSEVRRVVRPGGVFAGTDSTGRGLGFALLHIGDVRNVLDPEELPGRLQTAGFERASVDWNADTLRFRAE
jgi:SAM-dependent methyltransferase